MKALYLLNLDKDHNHLHLDWMRRWGVDHTKPVELEGDPVKGDLAYYRHHQLGKCTFEFKAFDFLPPVEKNLEGYM
jgi:hypothetical protein